MTKVIHITDLIFVFGSNLAGRHGKGSAKYARDHLGARYGIGEGPTGQCYALPTKDFNIKTRSLEEIEVSIDSFISVASSKGYRHNLFLVTPIGCGLAGYKVGQIRSIFMRKDLPNNLVFSKEWFQPYREVSVYE